MIVSNPSSSDYDVTNLQQRDHLGPSFLKGEGIKSGSYLAYASSPGRWVSRSSRTSPEWMVQTESLIFCLFYYDSAELGLCSAQTVYFLFIHFLQCPSLQVYTDMVVALIEEHVYSFICRTFFAYTWNIKRESNQLHLFTKLSHVAAARVMYPWIPSFSSAFFQPFSSLFLFSCMI